MTRSGLSRLLNWFGLAIGLFALLVQFYLNVLAMPDGRSILGGLSFYFSFLTILTNWLVVLTHAALLGLLGRPFNLLARPRVYNGVLAAIILVFVAFHALLAGLVELTGITIVTDFIFHTLVPIVFVMWWFVGGVHGKAKRSDPLWWVLWPVCYLIYALTRSFIVGEVPYPFLNYWTLGWNAVFKTIGVILCGFLVGAWLLVLIDRMITRKNKLT